MKAPPDPGRPGRRRVVDFARVLPFVGTFLFLLPAFWGGTGPVKLAWAGVYVFAVWAILIGASALLSRLIARGDVDARDE